MGIAIIPPGQGTLNVVYTNFFRGYQVPGGVADLLAPRVPVFTQDGQYLIENTDQGLILDTNLLRAPGTRPAQRKTSGPTYGNFSIPSRALETPIPDEDKLKYKLGNLKDRARQTNQLQLMTDREVRLYGLLANPANYASTNTLALSGNSQIDNANSDVPSLIEAQRRAMSLYVDPNTLVLSYNVWSAMRTNKSLIGKYQGVLPVAGLTDQQLAQILQIDRVIIAKPLTYANGARARIWNNVMLFCYVSPTDAGSPTYLDPKTGLTALSPLDASLAKTFVWTEAPGTVDGYGVLEWRDPAVSAKTDWISHDWYAQEYLTSNASGFLTTNCLATP